MLQIVSTEPHEAYYSRYFYNGGHPMALSYSGGGVFLPSEKFKMNRVTIPLTMYVICFSSEIYFSLLEGDSQCQGQYSLTFQRVSPMYMIEKSSTSPRRGANLRE